MNLAQALRFAGAAALSTAPPRLAFVGAGGKTTALFQLARQLAGERFPTVFVTPTTHLAVSQAALADRHLVLESTTKLEELAAHLSKGVVLLSGPTDEAGRLSGLEAPLLEGLHDLSEALQIPLLVEADGARLRPLKAPAEHEPAVPSFVDTLVVVAGLSGLGKPLGPEWVHRPERFGVLAGLEAGQEITGESLGWVLADPEGGLKGIPLAARRVLLLNQADRPELVRAGQRLAESCGGVYAAVIVAALQPLTRPSSPEVYSVHEPAAAILLAAGGSRRFGRPKQLLDWGGQPLVRHVASLALAANFARVRVVVGAHADEVGQALEGLPIETVENPAWEEGQASSVRAGVRGLPAETGGAVFLLVDQPQVPVSLLQGLLELHAQTLSPLAAPLCQGRRANPVLFDRVTFAELQALQGDAGGRALFASPQGYPVAWLPWEDERLLLDLDTPEDLAKMAGGA